MPETTPTQPLIARWLDRLASFPVLALISLVLLLVVAVWLNPAKAGSYIWAVSKISMAAVLGEACYRATTRGHEPGDDALAQSMAQTRRATLIAAAIIAAGLMA